MHCWPGVAGLSGLVSKSYVWKCVSEKRHRSMATSAASRPWQEYPSNLHWGLPEAEQDHRRAMLDSEAPRIFSDQDNVEVWSSDAGEYIHRCSATGRPPCKR